MPETALRTVIELAVVVYIAFAALCGTTTIAITATKLRRVWAAHTRTVKYRDIVRRGSLGVSVLLPVRNPADEVIAAVEHFTGLAHPRLEVIVVCDGSTEQTRKRLRESLELEEVTQRSTGPIATQGVLAIYRSRLWPGLQVVTKLPGGRADALNAGLNVARYHLICPVSTRTRLYPAALTVAIRRFETEPELAALGAAVTPLAKPTLFRALQLLTHARQTAMRTCQNKLQAFTRLSDDFAVMHRRDAIALGGFRADAQSSTDLVVRLQGHRLRKREPCSVRFHPDPAGEAEASATLSQQLRQWVNAQRHVARLPGPGRLLRLRPIHGRFAWLTLPWLSAEALLPAFEVLIWLGLLASAATGATAWGFVALAAVAVVSLGTLHNLLLLGVEGAVPRPETAADRARLFAAALIANLGWRQLEAFATTWAVMTAGLTRQAQTRS